MARGRTATRLAPDASRRQGDTTRMAMMLLGREAAIAFMNTHNDVLGARPIDLAIESEEGRLQVERALSDKANPPARGA